jgi:methylenetetrahydrofolate dehydrogenase (NADP+)/methenyltetrahydrofolate cyclohydrolase
MININSSPIILDGRHVANEVLKNVKIEINEIKANGKRVPGLAVVLVGNDPASETYVGSKEKKSIELGIYSEVYKLLDTTTEEELINIINLLNANTNIDGILVQLPLPKHLNTEKVIGNIHPSKDVDGLHPYNLGKLIAGERCLKPCTPLGVMEILKQYSIDIQGKKAVVIGRSILVGKPISLLLLDKNATVTIAHSKTQNLEDVCREADILVAAIGKPRFVKKDWIKKGAVVIDVGINRILENDKGKLVGDVDFENVSPLCKAITPVPGGVGPVTIAMLMSNTLEAYKMRSEE